MLRFPRALDPMDITWSVTTLLNNGSALHFTPRDFLCCIHSLFKYSLVVYYTVVYSSNFYVVLTSIVTMLCSGVDTFHRFMKDYVVFSYILNSAWV